MSNFSDEDKNECERIFNYLDKNKDNKLNINQVLLGLAALGKICTYNEQKKIENKYKSYDLNNFLKICAEKVNFRNIDFNLISYFKILESKDKPGYITNENLNFILKKFDENITEKQINDIVREIEDEEGNINIEQLVSEFINK